MNNIASQKMAIKLVENMMDRQDYLETDENDIENLISQLQCEIECLTETSLIYQYLRTCVSK